MGSADDPRARTIHDLANRLLTIGSRLEAIAAIGDPRAATLAGQALEDLAAARAILGLLSGPSSGEAATDLAQLMRQAESAGGRVHRGEAGDARVAIGAAAVHAVLESVLRSERARSPTVSAIAVGGRARVVVESSAKPFTAAERERLLDPMRLRNPDELGAGLAFSACAEIVRRAGGSFTLGGDERRQYAIELPLARAATAPGAHLILVVDDDDRVRDSIALLLRHLGHKTELVRDAASAARILQRREFGGVVVDLHLGRGSGGEELVRQIAERHPRLLPHTVISTGDPAGPEAAERLGVRLLPKPFGIEELRAIFG